MKRSKRGNMLIMSGVFVSINALALLIASSYGSLYFVHNRLQTTADELAILGTSMLNEQDRIGQMNNMIARSRQMVYDADTASTNVSTSLSHLSQIADQLHAEAREGAILLEQERSKLATVCTQDATAAVTARFAAIRQLHALVLPWLQVSEPSLQISFGRINAVQSNVNELPGIPALDRADSRSYISSNGSHLYQNNINAQLPGADNSLTFKLCSLPAPVQTSVSPARAALASKYIVATDDQISSAVQVKLQLDVATGMGPSSSAPMVVTGTAETTGGQPVI